MNASEVISRQRERLLALYRRHVSLGSTYALVDFPHHSNVGDSAIWAGEIALLRQVTGRDPSYVSTTWNFDGAALRAVCPDGLLFIHGGGNLGDIWPHHQRFRERVLTDVRDRTVVQLPQSIKFRDEAHVGRFADAIGGHPDAYLYVRDRRSLDFARSTFQTRVELAPDSALGLGLQRRNTSSCATLLLLRTDGETAGHDRRVLTAMPDSRMVDWLAEPTRFILSRKLRSGIDRLRGRRDAGPGRVAWYNYLASAHVGRGLRLLSQGEQVITDRLHAHILSLLLDIPHVALDNDYGKISGYIAEWTCDYERVVTAASAEEAVANAARLPGRAG